MKIKLTAVLYTIPFVVFLGLLYASAYLFPKTTLVVISIIAFLLFTAAIFSVIYKGLIDIEDKKSAIRDVINDLEKHQKEMRDIGDKFRELKSEANED